MSLKKVHDELEKRTPGGKESLLAWVLTFFLEAVAEFGSMLVFVGICALVLGLLAVVLHFA